ncbi:MAG TPA: EndoU domain-containing protein [Candidatus Angelobacter sp.]|nr:EndoU domain-containing protein [Candidatus Angelobacter sp.]
MTMTMTNKIASNTKSVACALAAAANTLKSAQRIRILSALFLALVALGLAGKASAQPNCNAAGQHWSATVPQVNQRHIFCGEIGSGGQPKGYHSTQNPPPTNVVVSVVNVVPIANGIYNATVNFNNHTHKISTFFPNACTANQIVQSVVYAANNQTGPAPGWGVYGMSAPPGGGAAYCLNSAAAPFRIKMGLLGNGDVNTAFPN